MRLYVDTETNGKADFGMMFRPEFQPHVVELAAYWTDEEFNVVRTLHAYRTLDELEKGVGRWDLHGVTEEICAEKGRPFKDVLTEFNENIHELGPTEIVAHNLQFDGVMLSSELARVAEPNHLRTMDKFCTMRRSTDIIKLPGRYGYKWPKLVEAHEFFYPGWNLDQAHNACFDVEMCIRVHVAILKYKEKRWEPTDTTVSNPISTNTRSKSTRDPGQI